MCLFLLFTPSEADFEFELYVTAVDVAVSEPVDSFKR
jgi:hypothetical protein